MHSDGSVEIDRSIEDVFRLTNDHVAEWSIIVVEDEVLEETPDFVGSSFRTVTEENGRRMEFQGTVTHYKPPHECCRALEKELNSLKQFCENYGPLTTKEPHNHAG